MNAHSVFRFGSGTEQDHYRRAVSQIIGDIKKAKSLELCQIAKAIEVTSPTICNAYNKRSDLSAVSLAKLGRVYGAAFLKPYHDLCEPPVSATTRDILPIALKLSTKIASARDKDGPGGVVEVPQERLGYLNDAKELHRELGGQIAHIESVLA